MYNRLYQQLILNRDQIQILNVPHARVIILKNTENRMDSTLQVSTVITLVMCFMLTLKIIICEYQYIFQCTICLESLPKPEENRGGMEVTVCGHLFHTNCINQCLKK